MNATKMKATNAVLSCVLTALVLLALPALAAKPVNVAEVPVITKVRGSGVLPDPAVPNDRLQSDRLGDYFHGVNQVISHLQGGQFGTGAGDWEMYTGDSAVRELTIDLREPVDASANPPFAYSTLPARIIVKCHIVSPASIGGMRGLNSTLVCLMNVRFYIGRDSYVLSMNRAEFPDTNDALVTCSEVSGDPADPNAPCTGWTVDPSVTDSSGPRNMGRLLIPGKGGTMEDRGRFYVRFHISFHK